KRRASLIPTVRALAETESTLLVLAPEEEEQENSGSEPEEVREIRDVLGRLMRGEAELRESVDHLEHDEEADHDKGGKLQDRDEDSEEHECRHPGRGEHHDVRSEDSGDRPGRPDHGLGLDESLTDRGDDPTKDVEDQVGSTPQAILDVIAEDPEIDHVPDDVQPAAVQEHVGDEWHEGGEREMALPDLRRELFPIERIAIVEGGDRVRLSHQREDIEPHEDVGDDQESVDDRRLRRRVLVAERDHARSSVATTFDPWIVKIVRELSDT